MAGCGYESEAFAEPPEKLKDYECPLCLHITREPYLTSCCGHHFCQSCIGRVHSDNKPCPLCKAPNFAVFQDKKQKRKVLELRARCMNRGCTWTHEFGGLEGHLNNDCLFVFVPCSNGCGQAPQRGLLSRHLQEACPMRLHHCMYCGFAAQHQEVRRHWAMCQKYPVPCPNNCQMCTIERGGLEQHLTQCPLQSVPCEFSQFGCTERLYRQDLASHREKGVAQHLSLVSAFSLKTHEYLLRREQQVEELRGKLEVKDTQVRELWGKLTTRDSQVELLRRRVETLELCAQSCCLPPFSFTLSNITHFKEKNLGWDGPNFYTQQRGAKLKIRVFFSQRDKEMAIKFYQLPGESDERIVWPLQCTVKVLVIDQLSHRYNLENSIRMTLRQCRSSEVNVGILRVGYVRLCNTPEGSLYLKDDSLLLRVTATI